MRNSLLVAVSMLAAVTASADCSQTAARKVSASLDGISRIRVIGRAGTLRVIGQAGARQATATGTACADEKGSLNDIQLETHRNGSELQIEAVIPEKVMFFGWSEMRLDFEVTVPNTIALDVNDGSGEATIENVGATRVVDGSGSLTIRGVHGDLDVEDGSGELIISDVDGSVSVEDGSGSLEIHNVGRDVTVDDGSGSIDVHDVRGNFTVKDDGSGGIDYERISGRVDVPRRHR